MKELHEENHYKTYPIKSYDAKFLPRKKNKINKVTDWQFDIYCHVNIIGTFYLSFFQIVYHYDSIFCTITRYLSR